MKTCRTCGNKNEDGYCTITDPILVCLGWGDDYKHWIPVIDFVDFEFIEQEEMEL